MSTPLAASWMALSPDPQTLLMVSAEVEEGRPPFKAACRAGAWPTPAETTLPKMASLTGSPGNRSSRAFTTGAANSGADKDESPPWNFPTGVRRHLRITAWDMGGLWEKPHSRMNAEVKGGTWK